MPLGDDAMMKAETALLDVHRLGEAERLLTLAPVERCSGFPRTWRTQCTQWC
jgi:hypothetical protein